MGLVCHGLSKIGYPKILWLNDVEYQVPIQIVIF